MSERWQCPQCHNHYRYTTQCPECSTPTLQQIGSHHQGNVILGDNNAPITQQTVIASPPPRHSDASYQLQPRRRFASVAAVTAPSNAAGIVGVSLMALGFVADATSVLETVFGENTALPQLLIFVTGFVLSVAWLKFARRNANLASAGLARSGADVYQVSPDGSVTLHSVHAKCPVPHCDGHLNLVSPPPPNQEGIQRPLGICDTHGLPHAFEFNLGSLKGNRVTLHPREQPTPQHR